MKIEETQFKGLYIIEPEIYKDDRGLFFESWNDSIYSEFLSNYKFVQDNYSISSKHVLRGLHFQKSSPQGKLIRVIKGKVLDVAVDLRKKEKTFGKYFSIILREDEIKQVFIPPEFAHGFLVLSDFAEFQYKTTEYYHPEHERAILWNDPDLNINWNLNGAQPKLSPKDALGDKFKDLNIDF